MKAATREIVDRENRVLREARDGAEAEVRRLQAQLARLTEGSAAYERSASAQASAREVELTSLRGDLRIKAFELASLSTVFEERSSELRQARTELDLVRAEVAAHRNALQQLERAGEVQVLQLSSELESAKSRLAVYASWEREMDEAVVHAAKTSDPVDRRTALGALTGGPVNYDRRIAQVVQLAQKLRLCEVTGEQQAREILSLRDELAAARRDVERSALDSERSMQPASYLVQRLRETEEFVEGAKAKCAELEKTLSTCARQLSLAEGERDDVRERLSVVLQQREELDGMRRALEELRQRALDEEQEQEDSLNESQEQSPPLLADHPVYPDPSAASGMLGLSAELMSRLTTPLRHKDSGKKWHKRVVLD
jgi:DNA repair exonuclease SbcCD ATPase subunit